MKRIALAIGILLGLSALLAVTTSWEPESAYVKAHKFAIGAFLLCFLLVWYGLSRQRQ